MQADPLQQLRDVHSPLDPAWWPPAPGWWIIGVLLLAGLLWLVWQAVRAWRKRAPIRVARRLHKTYSQELSEGHITAAEYLHKSNELLKRVLVSSYHRYRFAPLSGEAWLSELDRLSETDLFTAGPGRALGDNRFAPVPEIDAPGLPEAIDNVIKASVTVA